MVSIDDIQLPPHHIEAEKSVLSAVFLDNEIMYMLEAIGIKPEDFYKREHTSIFSAMMTLRDRRATIDVVTLSDQLTKNAVLDNIGGLDYLYDINTYLISTSGCGEYAQIVKEKSTLRKILKVSQGIIGDVYDHKDTIHILDAIEKKVFDLTQVTTGQGIKHIKDILGGRVEEYMAIVDDPSKADEKKTFSGYPALDELFGGFKPGELIIVAARPSMGKTAFSLNILIHAALEQKKTIAFFSLEMSSDQIVDRILSTIAGVPMYKISKGNMDADDFDRIGRATEELSDTNVYLDDKGTSTVNVLKSKLRRLKVEKGTLDLVVVDYLQLMSGEGMKFAGNRVLEISEISRALKELAKELSVPIVVLSQLSRNVEQRIDKQPQLSDLRDSGAIEQDADGVLMLFREEYYDTDTDRKGATDVFVRKNRNGPIGEVELYFDKQTMKFVSLGDAGGGDDGTY